MQRYNSPAAIVRKLFKPSTDSASLSVSTKQNVLIWVRGSLGGKSQMGVFLNLDKIWLALGANPMSDFCFKIFLETRESSASVETLIDLLACLEPELWAQNPIVSQNKKIAEKHESPTGGLHG